MAAHGVEGDDVADRHPTNSDILKKLNDMSTTLQSTVKDVSELKTWRIGQEAAKKAVEEYKRSEEANTVMSWIGRIAPLIVAVLTALYAYLQVHK